MRAVEALLDARYHSPCSFPPALDIGSGSEAGSYLRRIDCCITQLKAQGPSRTCNESKEEEAEDSSGAGWCGGGVIIR